MLATRLAPAAIAPPIVVFMAQKRIAVAPDDEHNHRLVAAVRPSGWLDPEPSGRYNLVVIGAGTAGLVAAAGAAGLGARVALIERHLMGGDCLNVGCVPSKALIRSARIAAHARDGARHGVHVQDVEVDFAEVMARMRALRADIAPADSAARFRDLGIDVYFGQARFASPREIVIDRGESQSRDAGVPDDASVPGDAGDRTPTPRRRLRFARAVIASGARARVPEIPGLADAGYLTNDTLFELTELPARLAIIGGGPIGCEMAQCFARFGSRVTLVEASDRILGKEESDAAEIVARALGDDDVTVLTGARVVRVDREAAAQPDTAKDGARRLTLEHGGDTRTVSADAILVAAGRRANIEGLDLERAGIASDDRGVVVDDFLRTGNRRVFASGDVASSMQFTHAADAMSRLVLRNALFFGRQKRSSLIIPRVTFTDPEIAAVGMTAEQAAERAIDIDTFELPLAEVDRAVIDGQTAGLIKVHTRRGRDTIVGATLVAPHAGELIGEITLAMTAGLGLSAISTAIHPYPTTALALRQVADRYQRTRLTPRLARIFQTLLAWRRR